MVNCSCCKPFKHTETSNTTNITDLDPGSHCNISITAVSGQLHSLPLIYYNMKTEEKGKMSFPWDTVFVFSLSNACYNPDFELIFSVVASHKVTNVIVTNVNSSEFKVLWTEPDITNGDLLHYLVNISNWSFFDSIHVDVSSPMFLFEDLTPGKGLLNICAFL